MGKGHKGGRKHYSEPADEEVEPDEGGGSKSGRGMGNQNSNVGMLPPNSSDEEEEVPRQKKGQSDTAGMLPPNSSDEEEDESEDEAPGVQLTRKEREQLEAQKPEEPDPEQISQDMERLALIKAKREQQAKDRIAKDGWDRMKPISDDNHPPGMKWPPASAAD